jgi:hypothetical protein
MLQEPRTPEQAYRAVQSVWFALLASMGSYAVVGWVLARAVGPLEPDPTSPVRLVLQAAGLGTAVVAVVLGRLLLQPERLAASAAGTRSPYQQILGQHVIVYAVAETPAMLGLVLYLVGGSPVDLAVFVALGALALALVYPRRAAWDALVAALGRRRPDQPHTR